MPNNGIMKEIRSLLDQDKSRAEIIALGYKPATVDKVQRQSRQENPKSEETPPQDLTTVPAANSSDFGFSCSTFSADSASPAPSGRGKLSHPCTKYLITSLADATSNGPRITPPSPNC